MLRRPRFRHRPCSLACALLVLNLIVNASPQTTAFTYQGNNGNENAFFGMFAGINNRGPGNVGVGFKAGISNGTGSNNTYVGYNANDNDSNLTNSTAIGANALVTQSNSLVLGSVSVKVGIGASAPSANALVTQSNSLVLGSVSVKVGIGASAPKTKLHVSGGKIYVEANGEGVILKSAGGTCFELTVTDAGVLTTAAVTCP